MNDKPERVISYAVDGMLPHNHLHDKMMKRLRYSLALIRSKPKLQRLLLPKQSKKKAEIRKIAVKVETKTKKEAKR
jgi:ribosomal protein L13